MTEPTLASLHPYHFPDWHLSPLPSQHGLQGSYILNLPRVSRSLELSRPYHPGDPIRLIDWKAYARNDQLIVRQEKNESMAKVIIVLDASPTMDWPDTRVHDEVGEQLVTKFAISTRIALHLAHRHLRMGDRVQLVFLQEDPKAMLGEQGRSPATALCLDFKGASDVLSFYYYLELEGFSQESCEGFLFSKPLSYLGSNAVYWLSDLCNYELPKEIFMKADKVCLFHILSHLECDSSWMKDKTCYYEHDGLVKEFMGRELRKNNAYNLRLQQWLEKTKKSVEQKKGLYALFTNQSSLRSYAAMLDHLVRWRV